MNEYERVLLSTLSHSPYLMPTVAAIVTPERFESRAAADVYRQMLHGRAFDPSVIASLVARDTLAELGGVSGLCEALAFPPSNDVVAVARAIREAWERRRASAIFESARRRLDNGVSPLEAVREALGCIAQVVSPDSRAVSSEAVDQALAEYEAGVLAKDAPGFGIGALDRAIGGIRPGRFHIVSAYPGGGKTTLMVQAAIRAARHGVVVYVSAEMTVPQIVAIAVSHLGQVDMSPEAIRRRRDGQPGNDQVRAGLDALRQTRLYVVEHGSPSAADLALYCQQYKPDLIVCDYLQIMRSPPEAQNREQEVARNAQALKGIAMEYHCAVLTGSQQNREGQTRESDAPLHHCDVLLRIEARDQSPPIGPDVPVILNLLKNRGGTTMRVDGLFRRHLATFAALR